MNTKSNLKLCRISWWVWPTTGGQKKRAASACLLLMLAVLSGAGCRQDVPKANATSQPEVTFKPQEMADALHAVVAADREVYSLHVVQRLSTDENVLKTTGNWKQEKGLPLPEQMLRMGSEAVQQKGAEFHYILRSLWPINSKDAPQTETEKTGLEFVAEHPDTNYYASESLGGRRYFTAVYPDTALGKACIDCHNQHQDSPRRDFKVGEVIGGIIVRVPLEF